MARTFPFAHRAGSLWRVCGAAILALLASAPGARGSIEPLKVELPDYDSRSGTVAPTSSQLAAVSALGARAQWNIFGTPSSLVRPGGYLATGLSGDPATAARNFIRAQKELFRLSDQGVSDLELLSVNAMFASNGKAAVFRQRFGGLPAAQDGTITVGLSAGKVTFVSSSSSGDRGAPGAPVLSPVDAWIAAAQSVGRPVSPSSVSNVRDVGGWKQFAVSGFSDEQRTRLMAFPRPNDVRPVWVALVVDVQGETVMGYTVLVDAQTAQVLFRQNNVYHASDARVFSGAYNPEPPPAGTCGSHVFTIPAGTKTITVAAHAVVPTNDIILDLIYPAGSGIVVAHSDTATSPEGIHYSPGAGVTPGDYEVRICPYLNAPPVPHTEPYDYVGTIAWQDAAGTATFPYPPKWKVFPDTPLPSYASTDIRKVWCWELRVNGIDVPGCEMELKNLAARVPWDHQVQLNTPSFTTHGNYADSGEAWLAPPIPVVCGTTALCSITPAELYHPVATDRQYVFPWTNSWNSNKCSQAAFSPAANRNDIDAAIANLFAMHNRMHDWSYFLGFTEQNFNLQWNNFGLTPPGPFPAGQENDFEIGTAQTGALSGGPPNFSGRNNALQLTLPYDGLAGLTAMYLWQPWAGVIYSPCADGDFDMTVIGHEYTHAITNRMVGGRDQNISGAQGAMLGESWSDINAVEYLSEYGFAPVADENPFAVGAYVGGVKSTGIRNYGMNFSPLNYSNVGYDLGGSPTGHSDSEIHSAVSFDVRQLLVTKYNGSAPSLDAQLQRDCADGKRPANQCPGNRRWAQIMHDAWLLMPSAVSFLDARSAYLAADQARFGGANQREIWLGSARRGMGWSASTNTNNDLDPTPGFDLPPAAQCPACPANANVGFKVVSREESHPSCTTGCNTELGRKPIQAKVYVGRYEARSVPIVVTVANHSHTPTPVKFAPGTYDFLVVAPGYGHFRFQRTFTAGQNATLIPWIPKNYASKTHGAVATGDGDQASLQNLIDDTETTNWAKRGAVPPTQAPHPAGTDVTVKLAGGPRSIARVQVSAYLRPADAADPGGDTAGQNRFTALRQFEIYTCTESPTNPNCANPAGFTKVYTSPLDAFPGRSLRPMAPDLNIRSFDIPATTASHVRLHVVTNQCIGGPYTDTENDLSHDSDCRTGSVQDDTVRAAELQVFTNGGAVGVPGDPVVTLTMDAPATAAPGSALTYVMRYTNLGPEPSSNARITDTLPAEVTFVSATSGGRYDPATRAVTWSLGTVPVTFTGSVSLTVQIPPTALPGTAIANQAQFTGDLTVSPPTAAAVTLVLP